MFKSSGSYKISPLEGFAQSNGEKGQKEEQPSAEELKSTWSCIYLCSLFTFTASVQFTMFLTSLWPFMQIVSFARISNFILIFFLFLVGQNGDRKFLRFGDRFVLPLPDCGLSHSRHLGKSHWEAEASIVRPSKNSRSTPSPHLRIFCNVMMFIGNLLYFIVELFPPALSRYVLIISRLISGVGYAQVGLLKSYSSAASVPKDRSRAVAFITGGVSLGLTLGPG